MLFCGNSTKTVRFPQGIKKPQDAGIIGISAVYTLFLYDT